MAAGRPAEALSEFGRVLALSPRNPQALNNRGVALSALGQNEAASRDWREALEIEPCLFDARWNLMRIGAPPPAASGCRYTVEQEALLRENR
jgi:Flp pilus assembly protein TadD